MRKPQHPPRAIKREVLPNGVRVIGHTPVIIGKPPETGLWEVNCDSLKSSDSDGLRRRLQKAPVGMRRWRYAVAFVGLIK